jgi:putative restriction endonuclease
MDDAIRLFAFNWLTDQIKIHGKVLPRILLEKGFIFENQQIILIGPRGIWKPKMMELPLTITTIYESRYNDGFIKEGLIRYSYRGQNPNHPDNFGLRKIWQLKKPLIYFVAVAPGRYYAEFPVFIINDNPAALTFTVQVDEMNALNQVTSLEDTDATYWRRAYLTTTTKIRVHQRSFRERVLIAYQTQCTFCRLRHNELLDGAHIISDGEEKGDPIVPNGLALCKIHHAAFDSNIIGVTPDYDLHVREDILHEIDGPMLKYGLQSLQGNKLILPNHRRDFPDKERLEYRYDQFRKAG